MNKPSDPMQGFLEQLLQDWETGGTKTPAAPLKPAKAAVGTIVETPGIASVVRALPELAEAVSLNATDDLPSVPAVVAAAPTPLAAVPEPVADEPAPAIAQTPWPSVSWEPAPAEAAEVEARKAEQPVSKPAFQWKPLAELSRTETSSPETTPIKVVVPTQGPVATAPAPTPDWEGETAAFAPPPLEHAKPVLQWKPAPPPSASAAGSKAEAAAADPLADTAPQFSKPTFQWKPSPPTTVAAPAPEDRPETPPAPAAAEPPTPAFQWKLAQPSAPSSASAAPPVVTASETASAVSAPAAAPAPLAVTAISSATPALVDFAAALSALKASRPTKTPAPAPDVEPEIVELDTVVEPAAAVIEELAVVEVEPEVFAVVTSPEPAAFLSPACEQEIAEEPAAETPAPPIPQVDDQPESAVNMLVSELPTEESAALEMAADEEALLTSLLYEQKTAFDLWDEPVPEAEPSARFEPEVLTEPEAAFEAEETTAPEAVVEPEAIVVPEAAFEPEVVVQPEAVVEAPAEVTELEPEPIAAPPQRAFGLQSLTPVEPEWEEIAVPPMPAPSGNGKELASAVSHFETSLPAGQWDQSAGTRRLDLRRHLVFSINDEKFAVNLDNLVEIDNMPTWTGIPGLPNSIRGLINLRGEIVSLLELRSILGLPHPEIPKKGKIFVATTSDRQAVSAFAVDDIEGIIGFDPAKMTVIPDMTASKAARNITATVEDGDRLIRILDVGGVLTEIEQTFSLDQVWM